MQRIQIYREDLPLVEIVPSNDSAQIKRIMGENELRVNFKMNQYVRFRIGDWMEVFDERYYITTLPTVDKFSSREYDYVCVFGSTRNILSRVQMLFLGDDNSLKEGEFSLTGTAQQFIDLLIQNTQRLAPAFHFKAGQVNGSDYKTISFKTTNCLDALAQIAEAFSTEYWIEGETIHLTKIGRDTGYQFRHGRRKGLYEINRKTVDNSQVITRLYAFGSDKNLPENYRNYSRRLKMPDMNRKTVTSITYSIFDNGDGTKTYTFNWNPPTIDDAEEIAVFYKPANASWGVSLLGTAPINGPFEITLPLPGDILSHSGYLFRFRTITPSTPITLDNRDNDTPDILIKESEPQPAFPFTGEVIFIEKNVGIYGLSEGTIIFDDIYPRRTGTVTSVNAGNEFEFTDSSVDFNLNNYLLPGMTAKVTFNSGQLSGYTFEISSFDNSTKRFVFLKNKNERAIDIPNDLLRPAIGDKYVLTDIKMPQSYIDAAELELLTRAQAELEVFCEPQMTYSLILDPVYMQEKKYNLRLGDLVWIIDDDFQVNRKFRIVTIQRNIVNPYDYTIELADTIREPLIQALASGQNSLTGSVNQINNVLQNSAIQNNRVIGDLIITSQGAIKFDDLQTGTGLTAIGIGEDGRVYKF